VEDSHATGGAAEIDRLVAGLDAPRYAERQSASEKLEALGVSALPALEKAAQGESLEVATRAIELLKKLLDSSEASTQSDARQALQRLAKSDRPKASRLAAEALKAKEQEDAISAAQRANGRFGGIAIQLAPGINVRRVRMQNNNGRRQIDVEEGNRKIQINDGGGQPIKIEVTTKTAKGKDSTEKYEAKDVDELKKKCPEGYKIYADWQNQANPLGLAAGRGINVRGGVAPALLPQQQAPEQQVRLATAVLRSLQHHVDSLTKGDLVQKATPQAKTELKQAIDQLKQTLADVEKRLQDKPETPAAKPDAGRGANPPK
jgi:hypothetical protein